MKKRTGMYAMGLAAVLAAGALAPVTVATPAGAQEQAQEQVYGSQLMTAEERAAYRQRLMAAKTEEERNQIRAEHHVRMQERAKEKGVTLPDEPPMGGMHMGPGMGGGGMGPGKGMGK
jgi:hypothetical protein